MVTNVRIVTDVGTVVMPQEQKLTDVQVTEMMNELRKAVAGGGALSGMDINGIAVVVPLAQARRIEIYDD